MNLQRLKLLEELLQEQPDDPFNLYAIALECLTENPDRAGHLFEQLLSQHPAYVPTYYQAGNYYWSKGNAERAIFIIRTGIDRAKISGDTKASGELRTLLDAFED